MAWVEPETWYRNLPTFYAAAGVLITDPLGRILLVKPNYHGHWVFPGGMIEANEAPHQAAARELTEELGLKVAMGPLLVVDWAAPMGKRPSAIAYFLFDGGTVEDALQLTIDEGELDQACFFALVECRSLVPAHTVQRVEAGMAARESGKTRYLPE
jgi:8-oxo-dGTP diphosphatase